MYLISDLQMKAGIHQGFQMEGRGDRASGGWLSFAPTSSHCCLLWMPPRLVQWEERGRNEGRRKKKVRRGRQPESQGGKQNKGAGSRGIKQTKKYNRQECQPIQGGRERRRKRGRKKQRGRNKGQEENSVGLETKPWGKQRGRKKRQRRKELYK